MRKALFWIHLTAGCTAGLVVLMMSVTGVLLTYEQQIVAWAENQTRSTPGAKRLSPEELLAKLRESGQPAPAALSLRAGATDPVEVTFGRDRIFYIDAYSGSVLGQPAQRTRAFFRGVTEWHRWFAAQGTSRATARAITGACNLAFLLLAISGLYLWLPRRWTWQHVKPVVFFRRRLHGRARNFNWHNVIGVWCSVPLAAITISGAVMSYPWANNLVYRLTGSEAPKLPQRSERLTDRSDVGPIDTTGMDVAWERAVQTVQAWRVITLRMPNSAKAPWTFNIEGSHRGRPDLRSTLVIDRNTFNVIRHETFDTFNAGRRARSWLRFIHTGEAGGVAGQTIAGLASAGGCVLVWTGISLALRRLRNAVRRDPVREYQATA
jgi:uncharacterized iron-regulated membrane protein